MKIAILVLCFAGSALAGTIKAIQPKVVNGTDTDILSFPSMISLRRNGGHSCGGTLLNEEWVLTAAHCALSSLEGYTVQYGNTVISREGTNVVGVAELIPHEGYDPDNQYIHDIALVRLAEPISNAPENFKVKLPLDGSYFATGTPSVLSGWGLNATGGIVQSTLQAVDLQIFSAFDCDLLHRSKVHYTNICGGIPEGGKGQCSGDSGGPLFVQGVQVGIVSWSVKPCTVAPYPGVYTATSHYIKWIAEKTGIDFKLNIFLRADDAPRPEPATV